MKKRHATVSKGRSLGSVGPARQLQKLAEEKLRANTRVAKDRELYLMADRSLPYGFVVEVMAAVQRAGVTNLGMITDPVPDRPEGRR